jgi:uncharacterized protein (DUF1501 family)
MQFSLFSSAVPAFSNEIVQDIPIAAMAEWHMDTVIWVCSSFSRTYRCQYMQLTDHIC